jgi:hypothetical protein
VPDSPAPRRASPDVAGPTRRAVVAAGFTGLVGLALAGCSDDTEPGSKPPDTPAGLTPDVSVATAALAEIRAVREAVAATVARFPATRPTLGPLVALHRTHEATLVDAVPARAATSSTPAPYAVPHRRDRAVSALATREQRLHDRLDQLAVRAQSGQFARLLASMGAALHQRLAVWEP